MSELGVVKHLDIVARNIAADIVSSGTVDIMRLVTRGLGKYFGT